MSFPNPDETRITVLFLCLARNCERTLPIFFEYLVQLETFGFRCSAIIGENGSSDGTRNLIEQASLSSQVELFDTSLMGEGKSRLSRMARGRQSLLERARQRGLVEEYICVADLDDVIIFPPNPTGVKGAIQRLHSDDKLFAVGANSTPFYYDLLSLRAEGHDYCDLDSEIQVAKTRPFTYFQFQKRRIYENQKRVPTREPILCLSSFNGFCIYNAKDYFLGSYRADNEAKVCEHVSLCSSINHANGKRMLIVPELLLQTPKDHYPVSAFRFWSDRLKKLFL